MRNANACIADKRVCDVESVRKEFMRIISWRTCQKANLSCANKNKKPKHDPEQGGKKEPLGRGARRLRSKDHELAECEQFISNEIQARFDIVKWNKLCHVCVKSGHMRGRCESRIFCSSGSDRRHHRLLHNPFRLRDAITAQDPHLDRQREIQAAQADIHPRIKECTFLKIQERWNRTQPSQKLLQELFSCTLCKFK